MIRAPVGAGRNKKNAAAEKSKAYENSGIKTDAQQCGAQPG